MMFILNQKQIDKEFDDLCKFTNMIKEILKVAIANLPMRPLVMFMAELEGVSRQFLDVIREDSPVIRAHVDVARQTVAEAQEISNESTENTNRSDKPDGSPLELSRRD